MFRKRVGSHWLLQAIVITAGCFLVKAGQAGQLRQTVSTDASPSLRCFPSTVNFNEVPRGQSRERVLYVENSSDTPVFIVGAATGSTNIQVVGLQNMVPPHALARVRLAFTPGQPSLYTGALILNTQPPAAMPPPIALYGRTSNLQSTPLPQATSLMLTPLSMRRTSSGVDRRYLIEVEPLAPSAIQPSMVLDIPGGFPQGVEAKLSTSGFELGPLQLAELSVFAPHKLGSSFQFETCGEVLDGGPVVFCDEGEFNPAPEENHPGETTLPCNCIHPPPALHLLDLKTLGFADPDTGEDGPPPSRVPVGTVSATLWGPAAGECCPGGKFELDLCVDSEAVTPPFNELENNKLTAWYLASGFCNKNGFTLKAETNGRRQAIQTASFTPINCDTITDTVSTMGRVILVTTATVDVTCEQAGLCPCSVDGNALVTRFTLGGESESGSIEVHWTVSVSGVDCRLTKATGKIKKIILTRNKQVFDPRNDKYVDQTGDPDQDHKSSYEEILKGGDPNDPRR